MTINSTRRGGVLASPPVDGFRALTAGQRARRALPQYGALAPYFFFFFAFGAMPMLFTMALAFTNWSGLGDIKFIGLENFGFLVTDPLFYKALVNTLILWVMGTVPTLTIATIVSAYLPRPRVSPCQATLSAPSRYRHSPAVVNGSPSSPA